MGRVLKESRSQNLVYYYVRNVYYEKTGMREKHEGPAKLKDVAELARKSRHVFQIMGLYVALTYACTFDKNGRCVLVEEKQREVLSTLYLGIPIATAFAALHARLSKLDTEKVVNDHYLSAFRKTISDLELEEERAIGIAMPRPARKTKEETSIVRMDAKRRIVIPDWVRLARGWKPGDKLRLRTEKDRICLELAETTGEDEDRTRFVEVYELATKELLEVIEGFSSNLIQLTPCTAEDIKIAARRNMSLVKVLPHSVKDYVKEMLHHLSTT